MPYTVAQRNAALDAANNGILFAQLHYGDPGGAGTSNVLSVASRENCSLDTEAAVNGAASEQAVFDITGATTEGSGTITHISLWTASSGGTFMGSGSLSPAESFAGAGTLTVTVNTSCTST